MSKKILILLTIVILIASILRLWRLGEVPISPDWDEVALGYNAYSIMETGRDEYDKILPIILRSFDDYKPALYAYLAIPSIFIFDLNVFSVRLPSAFFGILTVLAVFFLAKELFKKDNIALLSSFLLAISPWSIQFSRVAFESNIGVALNVFGVLFFLKSFKKPWLLFLSVFMMGLSLYVYQSEKVFVPLLCIALFFIFRRQIVLFKKSHLLTALLIFVFTAFPLVNFTLTHKGVFARAEGVSIFSDPAIIEANARKIVRDKVNNDLLGLILDNRRIEFAKKILDGYLSHFDLNWLFITGDPENNRHHAPRMGLLYISIIVFLFVGIYKLFFGSSENGMSKSSKLLIFAWFLSAPVAASVTSGVPHSVRTLNFIPTFEILISLGLISSFIFLKHTIKNNLYRIVLLAPVLLLFVLNFVYYIDQYFVQQNYKYAADWQYGYKEMVDYVKPLQNKYNKIIVSNIAPMDQSYMFFLFYLKYDPERYLRQGGTYSGGLEEVNKFANFEFRKFDYSKEGKNVLLIGSESDFPEVFKLVHTVNYPDKSVAIKAIEKD